MNRRPPAAAVWLLRTFGAGTTTDDLLGDLSEEYAAGRSAWWFWWQVLAAIPISITNEVRAHPVLTLRAIAIGWTAMFLLNIGGSFVQEVIEVNGYPWPRVDVPMYSPTAGVTMFIPINTWILIYAPVVAFVRIVLAAYLAGWLVGRLHVRHRVSAVLAFVGLLIAQSIYASSITPPRPADIWIIVAWPPFESRRWAFLLTPLVVSLLGGLRTRHLSPPVARE
jgi:hypothetical protein